MKILSEFVCFKQSLQEEVMAIIRKRFFSKRRKGGGSIIGGMMSPAEEKKNNGQNKTGNCEGVFWRLKGNFFVWKKLTWTQCYQILRKLRKFCHFGKNNWGLIKCLSNFNLLRQFFFVAMTKLNIWSLQQRKINHLPIWSHWNWHSYQDIGGGLKDQSTEWLWVRWP